jgi:hypothetical protein
MRGFFRKSADAVRQFGSLVESIKMRKTFVSTRVHLCSFVLTIKLTHYHTIKLSSFRDFIIRNRSLKIAFVAVDRRVTQCQVFC